LSRYFLDLGNNFVVTRDDLEDTIKHQRNQIEELEREKDQLDSSLVQSQDRIFYLEQEVNTWFNNTQNSFVDVKKTPGYIWQKSIRFDIYIYLENSRKKTRALIG